MADFQISVRVYHEDTDAGGIVYYANYLRFMERARTEFLRDAGFEQDVLMHREQRMFVVTAADIKYRQPARFNDLLTVSAVPVMFRRVSMEFTQCVRQADDSKLVCEASVSLACLDSSTKRPARMPDSLLQAFGSESGGNSGV